MTTMKHRVTITTTSLRKYTHTVYKAVAEYRGLPLDDYAMDIIDTNPKEDVLADFLRTGTYIGYTDAILSIINA